MRAIASCRSWRLRSLSACNALRVASVSVPERNSRVGEAASHQTGCIASEAVRRATSPKPCRWSAIIKPIAIARYMSSGSVLSALSLRDGALPG